MVSSKFLQLWYWEATEMNMIQIPNYREYYFEVEKW